MAIKQHNEKQKETRLKSLSVSMGAYKVTILYLIQIDRKCDLDFDKFDTIQTLTTFNKIGPILTKFELVMTSLSLF